MTARALCFLAVAAFVVIAQPLRASAGRPVVDKVLLLALPGRAWVDVDSAGPNLARLLASSSPASLSVRGVGAATTRADGYATIGAGNRARVRDATGSTEVMIAAARRTARHDLYGAEPGALGDALGAAGRATAVIGDDVSALAVADARGRVGERRDWPVPAASLPAAIAPAAVVLAEVPESVGLAGADGDIGALLDAFDLGHDLVLVVAPTYAGAPAARPTLTVFAAAGPGFGDSWARSATTRRDGYVTLPDVGVTILDALGIHVPDPMNGTAVTAGGRRPDSPRPRLVRANERAMYRDRAVGPVSVVFVALTVIVGAGTLARTYRRPAGPAIQPTQPGRPVDRPPDRQSDDAPPVRRRVLSNRHRFDKTVLTAGALGVLGVPGVAFLSGLTPYDRLPLGIYVPAVFAAAFAVAALAAFLLGPARAALALAGLTWSVLAVDIVTGGRLQIDTVLGYSPIVAGRFQGFGNVAFALLAQTAIVLATVALAVDPPARPARTVVAGAAVFLAITVLLDGAPPLGSDVGGVLAAVPAFAVALLVACGRRLGWRRVLVLVVAAAVSVAGLAAIDLARPADRRTHLGRFARRVLDGEAGTILRRKVVANWTILTSSPWTLLVPLIVAVFALAFSARGPLAHLVRRAADRALVTASLTLAAIGFAVNDSGVVVPALQLTVLVPWLALAVLAPRAAAGTP